MAFKLTHPDTTQEIEVEASQVPIYLGQGWVTKPTAPPVEVPDPAQPAPPVKTKAK